jgi:hypothetical protein
MNKTTALVVLVVGAAIVVAALADVFGMSHGIDMNFGLGELKRWPTDRIVLLAVGVALGLFGALLMFRSRKKK